MGILSERRNYNKKTIDILESKHNNNVVFDYDPNENPIEFDFAWDAARVLHNCKEMLLNYGVCTLYDYYGLINIDRWYQMARYGWHNLNDAKILKNKSNKYFILFPKIENLN